MLRLLHPLSREKEDEVLKDTNLWRAGEAAGLDQVRYFVRLTHRNRACVLDIQKILEKQCEWLPERLYFPQHPWQQVASRL